MTQHINTLLSNTPNAVSPTLSLGSKYRKVNLQGIPMPEASPSGVLEGHHANSAFHIDMFALALQTAFVDAHIPCEGGELNIQFFRSFSPSYIATSGSTKVGVLGMGWHSNINAQITKVTTKGTTIATVTDENGAEYTFIERQGGTGFQPFFTSPTANASRKIGFVVQSERTIFITKAQGTRLQYDRYEESTQGTQRIVRYRLTAVQDRNQNEIVYTYSTSVPFLVKSIHEKAHPLRKLQFKYTSIGSSPEPFDCGFRLTQLIDPMGQVTQFKYSSTNSSPDPMLHVLKAVLKPKVPFENAMVAPKYQFTYTAQRVPATPGNTTEDRVIALRKVIDPMGHPYTFLHELENFPQLGNNGTLLQLPQYTIRKIQTPEGSTFLKSEIRELQRVRTVVKNSDGIQNTYTFESAAIPITHQPIPGIFIHEFTRKTEDIGEVRYTFSPDPNQNLLAVDDLSGNRTEYRYTSGDETDAYNQKLDPNTPYDAIENPNAYQAFNQPAMEIVDVEGLQLTQTFRYEKKFNKLKALTNEEGLTTQYTFDNQGNRLQIIAPGNVISSFEYDPDGEVCAQTDADGRKIETKRIFTTEIAAHMKRITTLVGYIDNPFPTPSITTHIYDLLGNEQQSIDPKGNSTQHQYDVLYRRTAEIYPDVRSTEAQTEDSKETYAYDLLGRMITVTNAVGNKKTTQYDALGRVIASRIHMGDEGIRPTDEDIVVSFAYNFSGWKVQETDPNGNTYNYTYDTMGRLIQKEDPEVNGTRPISRFIYGANSGAGVFSYAEGWSPVTEINPRGFTTHHQYDSAYRLLRTIERKDEITTLQHNEAPVLGEPWTAFTYDKRGLMLTKTIGRSHENKELKPLQTVLLYDLQERVVATIHKQHPLTEAIDVSSPVSVQIECYSASEDSMHRTFYDQTGNIIKEIDEEGAITEYRYDGAARKLKTILPEREIHDPSGYHSNGAFKPTVTYEYDANGNQITVTDEHQTVSRSEYDARNRIITSSILMQGQTEDIVTTKTYTSDDRLASVTDGRGNRMCYEYDKAGREIRSYSPSHRSVTQETRTTYDHNSNIRHIAYEGGKTIESTYDALNRLTHIQVSPQRDEITGCRTTYDVNGNGIAIAYTLQGKTMTITRTFDAFDRLQSEIMPDIGDAILRKKVFAYYSSGKLFTAIDANGNQKEIIYDGLDRIQEALYHETRTQESYKRIFAYNKRGEVLKVVDEMGGTTLLDRDAIGQVKATHFSDADHDQYTLQTKYDARGNRTALHYPDTERIVEFTYDRSNRITKILDGDQITQYAYDSNHNLIQLQKPDGVRIDRAYDTFNRLIELQASMQKTQLYGATYEYALGGQCTQIEQQWHSGKALSTRYTYDHKERLLSEYWTATENESSEEGGIHYTYDALGNRLSETGTGSKANLHRTYAYNLLNQLTRIQEAGQDIDFAYDQNGNLVRETQNDTVKEFQWDCLNRLVGCTDGDEQLLYQAKYDHKDRKYATIDNGSTKIDRWHDAVSIQERIDNAYTDYVYGVGLGGGIGGLLYTQDAKQIKGYISNLHGHTVVTTDIQGNPLAEIGYTAFGSELFQDGDTQTTRLAYTKERVATLGLDYHGKRFYDPRSGRYISRDPLGFEDSVNNYLFVNNNPVLHIDQEGEWWDAIQFGLDVIGSIPVIGAPANIVNAAVSVCRGDIAGAGLSLMAAVPGVGAIAVAAKAAKHVKKAVDVAIKTKKVIDKVYEVKDKVDGALDFAAGVLVGDPVLAAEGASNFFGGKGKKKHKFHILNADAHGNGGGSGGKKKRRAKPQEKKQQDPQDVPPGETGFQGHGAYEDPDIIKKHPTKHDEHIPSKAFGGKVEGKGPAFSNLRKGGLTGGATKWYKKTYKDWIKAKPNMTKKELKKVRRTLWKMAEDQDKSIHNGGGALPTDPKEMDKLPRKKFQKRRKKW